MHPSSKRAYEMLARLKDFEDTVAWEQAVREEPTEMWVTPEPAKPKPQRSDDAMPEKDWSAWERWCDGRIAHALEAFSKELEEAVGEAMSEYAHARLTAESKKLREEIASLRADQTIDRAITRGEVSQLKAEVPIKRRTDAA
jgi:hypothetical protein